MKKIKNLLIVVVALGMLSCASETASKLTDPKSASFKFSTWITADKSRDPESYKPTFDKLKSSGLDAVLISTNTDPELLTQLTKVAKSSGLEVHAWIIAMNRPGDSVALQHPEWYVVSREGKSCFDTRPYVDHYQWMCPTRVASRNHVLSLVEGLAKVDGIASVHLDYIRFSDIFLPVGLLPKYNLIQNTELPEFDFCYCDECVRVFEEEHHKNPLQMEHPELDLEWRQFRLNQIKAVVDEAYEIVHKHGKQLSAAVFPYPEMAAQMVRQRWDKWAIDEVYPMVYHNFYNEEIDWIGFVTRQGIKDLEGSGTRLSTGVFVPEIAPGEMEEVINQAKENGAAGITFFSASSLSDKHLEVIRSVKSKL